VGTGFKAPSLKDITFPGQAFGNTGFHVCPPGLSAAKAAACAPIAQEYNIQQVGNPLSGIGGLKPEKSFQWTVGFRFEPADFLSFGADLWTVKIKDQINNVSEGTAFANGAQYESLFKVAPDPVTGTPTLTFLEVPVNTGKAVYQGIDLDAEGKVATPVGKLTTRLRGTYMIRADYQTPGTPGYINSMSKIGADTLVTFRFLINASATLQTGPFTNTLALSFKPGYKDDTLDYTRTDGSARDVSSYSVVDWQGRYDYNKSLSITLAVKNLFDTKPPFSILDQTGTSNARGVDSRYTDLIGRQFFLGANYKF
jgi:iron complex outermembrane receptor protein